MEVARTPTGCGAPPVWSAGGRATVLSCIGCGRIDTPQQCAGTCGEYAVEIVPAAAHDRTGARLAAARARVDALDGLTRRLAAHPDVDDWQAAYTALQADARAALRDPPTVAPVDERVAPIATWSCGCCGRMEAEAPCIGVCTDERLEVVRGDVHEQLVEELRAVDARLSALSALVRQLAFARPRDGTWAANLRALRDRAGALGAEHR